MTCEDCGAEMPCRAICDDCIEAYTASDNSDKAELRRERDEARRERDEARAQAVWSIHVNAPIGWVACAPGGGGEGLRLVDGAWVEQTMCISEGTRFSTEAEALAAGRALPWWEVQA